MKEWIYFIYHGKWYDSKSKTYGFPEKGDWYLDWDEWSIW